MTSIGLDGVDKPFEKPLTTTWLMFVAMSLAIPAMWIYSRLYPPPSPEDNKGINWKVGR